MGRFNKDLIEFKVEKIVVNRKCPNCDGGVLISDQSNIYLNSSKMIEFVRDEEPEMKQHFCNMCGQTQICMPWYPHFKDTVKASVVIDEIKNKGGLKKRERGRKNE